MKTNILQIIFYLLLIDSIGANLMSWGGGQKWYHKHFRIMSRYFPVTRGWTTYYLILIIFIGLLIFK